MIRRRAAFTLFELILAIALSATLLALIGMAVNLYLVRVDAGRSRVEEAQLARSILAMIADDVRATTVYQTQDTSAIAKLMTNQTSFDVDSIDKQRSGSSGGAGGGGASSGKSSGGGSSKNGSTSKSAATTSKGSVSTSSTGSASKAATAPSSANNQESDATLPLGLNGTADDIYVDSTRVPRQQELFSTITGYSNLETPMSTGASGVVPPADLKTVHYFVRQGESVDADALANSFGSSAKAGQTNAGGLVRQEVPRAMRTFAEQNGNSAVLDGAQVLIAPEVVQLELHYFDGSQVCDSWDMKERNSLPVAVEIRIWLDSAEANSAATGLNDLAGRMQNARLYRQTVFLPMSVVANQAAAQQTGAANSSSTTSSSSSAGSSFDSAGSGSGESQQ